MSFENYKKLLEQRLSPYRLNHSLGVAQSAAQLAERYGADVEQAYLAGLLHDITKEASEQEQLSLFKVCSINLTELEKSNQKLWHAMSAPVYIKTQLKIDDEQLLSAVRYHTTGRAGMSKLEKIVYIADFVSPDRVYDDVEAVRSLALTGLDEAMLYTQKYSIAELVKKGRSIHPDSVGCYNELVLNFAKHE